MHAYDLSSYPLCCYFLSGYLSATSDPSNFPNEQCPGIFDRYEKLFSSALEILRLTKEALRRRSEFNFDSGNAANLESSIAVLRVVVALQRCGFSNVAVVAPIKGSPGADLAAEKNGHRVCLEVKSITKQSTGKPELLIEAQLYGKICASLPRAREQLQATAVALQCGVKIFVCVVNWFDQSIYHEMSDFQNIVDQLERDDLLSGIDGVLFITKIGNDFLFLNQHGKCIDS